MFLLDAKVEFRFERSSHLSDDLFDFPTSTQGVKI